METSIFALGIAVLVIGIMTRRFIIGGLASMALLLYYFSLVANGSWLLMLVSAAGMLLILAEIFLPTFGLLGVIGAGMTASSVIYSTGDITTGLIDLSIALLLAVITFLVLLKLGYRLPISERMILTRSLTASGNQLQKADLTAFLHQEAFTTTPLRPTGKARFSDGQVLEVVSEFEIINTEEKVVVSQIKNNQIMVRRKM